MLLWLLFALMTAAVLAAVLRPLVTQRTAAASSAHADIAVYKDQLAELDVDTARGLITPSEAGLARREISRRLLARAAATDADTAAIATDAAAPPLVVRPRPVVATIALALPVAAIAAYVMLGSPQMPDAPHRRVAGQALERTPVGELVAKVEARLAEYPQEGKGWDVLAPIYFRQERFAEAANAYGRAIALLGETPARLAGFAESTVLANNGIVTDAARAAYETLAKADPSRVEPKFWLALAKEQDGRIAEAAADYRAILATAPPGATWRPLIEERIAAVEKSPGASQAAPRGPTGADVKAAEKLTEGERAEMIRGMVASLAEKLAANPADIQGWQRLMQSYLVLGEKPKAEAALRDARQKLAGNAQALADLAAIAKSLGLGS